MKTHPHRTPAHPGLLLLAAGLLAVEALAALVFGIVTLTQVQISRAALGSGVAILLIGYGVFLLLVARGVLRGRRWSRAPAVATQLILLPVAYSLRAEPTTWVAGALAVIAVGILVGVLHPRSTEVFVGPEPPSP